MPFPPLRRYLPLALAVVLLSPLGAQEAAPPAAFPPLPETMEAKVGRFASVEVGVPEARIPGKHRPALKRILQAAQLMDDLYLRQVAAENPLWRAQIAKQPDQAATLAYFDVMYGPWDLLEGFKPFWGEKTRPRGAAFYPEDLEAKELEAYLEAHPKEKAALVSPFTVLRRDGVSLKAVPYSEAYQEYLEPAARHLEAAAGLTPDRRLKAYLKARAAAFRSNDYRPSDLAWMDLGDGDLEVVIGPYETYNDQLMGWKAAFEAFVTLRDPVASRQLARIQAFLPEMERRLPLDKALRGPRRGRESPISVVNVLFNAGDNRPGAQTLAFNLPNDETVRAQKGSKKVLLKNISEAKFQKILLPIAKAMVREDQAARVTHEAFFQHTLLHEISHGLGPGILHLTREGRLVRTRVDAELKHLHSTLEEAKADVLGLHENLFLLDRKQAPEFLREDLFATYLAGLFRSLRFGAHEAHGQANAIQFNVLLEKGAIQKEAHGHFSYVAKKLPAAIRDLAERILQIQASGDFQAAQGFIDRYGTIDPALERRLATLTHIPTDLRLSFPLLKLAEGW